MQFWTAHQAIRYSDLKTVNIRYHTCSATATFEITRVELQKLERLIVPTEVVNSLSLVHSFSRLYNCRMVLLICKCHRVELVRLVHANTAYFVQLVLCTITERVIIGIWSQYTGVLHIRAQLSPDHNLP